MGMNMYSAVECAADPAQRSTSAGSASDSLPSRTTSRSTFERTQTSDLSFVRHAPRLSVVKTTYATTSTIPLYK